MGLAHEKKSYLQEKANLFEIGSKVFGLRRVIHPNPSAFKRKSGITGRVLRSLLFRFSFDSSRNRMWGRKCPGKTNWICFSSVV